MACVICLCGVRVEATDTRSLNDAYWSHTDDSHPDAPITPARRQNATDALLRTGGWDGERVAVSNAQIRPLSPDAVGDYLRFFDDDAFPDNPAWASCYCISYNIALPGDEFEERSAAENRAGKAGMIERGQATGVLAYAGGRVVGWCNAGPRALYPTLDRVPEFAADDAATAGVIVCFVIAPGARGQGLARKLLDGACEMLGERGLAHVDAYPPRRAGTDAGSYHGKLSMYLDAGFEEIRDAGRYVVVRKALR